MNKNSEIHFSYVLDANNQTVFSLREGKRVNQNPFDEYAGGLDVLVKRARNENTSNEPTPVIGFLKMMSVSFLRQHSSLRRILKKMRY